ncbi:MAG: DUF3160 domain-containing protein [Planctomycetota bacterium]|jgi:hypothetical protein
MAAKDIFEENIRRLIQSAGPELHIPAARKIQILERLTGGLAATGTVREDKSIHKKAVKSMMAGLAVAAVLVVAAIVVIYQFGNAKSVKLVGCRVYSLRQANYQVLGPRRIALERGEIFVEVCPAEEKVVVETPAGAATALGTKFYVKTNEREEQEMNKAKFMTTVMVVSGIVQLSNSYGAEKAGSGEVMAAAVDSAPRKQVEDLGARFSKYYEKVEVAARPSIPGYSLPLDLSKVVNFEKAGGQLGLAADEPLLKANGFVVVAHGGEDIVAPYERLKDMEIPIFVTADTLLHLYHVQFDESLKDIEEREFYDDLEKLSKAMQAESLRFYNHVFGGNKEKQEVARLLVGYASVAAALLEDGPNLTIPECVEEEVHAELDLIEAHQGFADSPLFKYAEDYSQYVPRGHYTRSEKLKRYFKAMIWYGRTTFLLKGGEPHGPDKPYLVSAAEATRQTAAAALLTQQWIAHDKLPAGRPVKEVLERIYTVTAFYVGLADDLGFEEYEYGIKQVGIGPLPSTKLPILYEAYHDALRAELAKLKAPAIYGGTGGQVTADEQARPEELLKALDKSTGFRLMGQRFIPDSYMMGKLVFPTVGAPNRKGMFTYVMTPNGPIRGFARGLDVMAVLGSGRARELLRELGDNDYGSNESGTNLKYEVVFKRLKHQFDALAESDWNRNIYWCWLHALKPLLKDFGQGYPTFMTTQAWRDKSLTTALASWAQLRHDTILYAKPSYAVATGGTGPKPVEGYVEPVPEFYARMLALTRITMKGLNEMNVLTPLAIDRLKGLEKIIARLLKISDKELANRELTKDDYRFIRNFGKELEKVTGNCPSLQKEMTEAYASDDLERYHELEKIARSESSMKTTLIADVHTDQNSGKALEEGTGYVDMIVICYLQPDGRLVLGAGPVLSYYEFKHPMQDRLTDEKWRQLLESPDAPPRPVWVTSFLRK